MTSIFEHKKESLISNYSKLKQYNMHNEMRFPEPEPPVLDSRNGGFHGRTGGGNAKEASRSKHFWKGHAGRNSHLLLDRSPCNL